MALYALKRLGAVLLILVVMSILVFLATHALPANTAALILGQYSTPETQAALEHKLGFDLPLPVQYWHWARGILLHGDLGQSLVMERPIAPILWDALGKSAILSVAAMTVVSTVGLAMGVVAAVRRGGWPDHAVSIFAYLGISVPEFYWGLVLILVFGSTLRLLPTSGAATLSDGIGEFVAHLVLPVITLTLTLLAHVSRLTRSSMIEVLDSTYVKVARARGLPERVVIMHHALRNALLPSITVLAQDFGFLIGGIVAVETIFAYPGLGRMLIFSLERQDLPLMQAAILVLTAVYCVANLCADLLYGVFNPRIRYGGAVD
jgi:peptide/nickel transport system permease protein